MSSLTQSLSQWLSELSNIQRMEELIVNDMGQDEKFYVIWSPWLMFKESAVFQIQALRSHGLEQIIGKNKIDQITKC